jgi:hypothetical protein
MPLLTSNAAAILIDSQYRQPISVRRKTSVVLQTGYVNQWFHHILRLIYAAHYGKAGKQRVCDHYKKKTYY